MGASSGRIGAGRWVRRQYEGGAAVALSILPWLHPAMAQSVPDFSGRWVAIEPAAVAGHELRIRQDDAVITLEQVRVDSRQAYDNLGRPVGDPKGEQESTTYRLDGKPTIAARSAGDGQQVRSTLRWETDRVVLMAFTRQPVSGSSARSPWIRRDAWCWYTGIQPPRVTSLHGHPSACSTLSASCSRSGSSGWPPGLGCCGVSAIRQEFPDTVMAKLAANDRAHAVTIALKQGILSVA